MAFKASGGEFAVNTTVAGVQRYSDIAALATASGAAAGYVSVWSDGGDTIRARLLGADGKAKGGEILVNAPADAILQDKPAVAALEGGGFVVAWRNFQTGIVAQRFDASGKKVGEDLRVNGADEAYQDKPSVSAVAGGGFAVTWEGRTSSSGLPNIFSQLVGANGAKIGAEQALSASASGFGAFNGATAKFGAGYVSVWQDNSGTTSKIVAQALSASGERSGSAFTVATAGNFVGSPTVVALTEGGYAVGWAFSDAPGSFGISAQMFGANGKAAGAKIEVAASSANFTSLPDIAALSDGGFAMPWQVRDNAMDTDVFARSFGAGGKAAGAAFKLNTVTAGEQTYAELAAGADGRLAAIWTGQNGGDFDIKGQGFSPEVDPTPTGAGKPTVELDASPVVGLDVGGNTMRKSFSPFEFGTNRAQSAALSDGGFVSLVRTAEDEGERLLQVQRFDARGDAVGQAVTVAKGATDDFNYWNVEGLADGRFAVTWTRKAPNPTSTLDSTISTRVYDAGGKAVGADATIGAAKHENRVIQSIEALKDGSYVVMWSARPDETAVPQCYMQRFDAANAKIGSEIRISAFANNGVIPHSLTLRDDGGYVLAWSAGSSFFGEKETIWVRVLNGNGAATAQLQVASSEFRISDTSVLALEGGKFAIAWSDRASGDARIMFHLEVHDAKGQKVGTQVTWASGGLLAAPKLLPTSSGLMAVWNAQVGDPSGQSAALMFDEAGRPIGSSFVFDEALDPGLGFPQRQYVPLKDGRIATVVTELAPSSVFNADGDPEFVSEGIDSYTYDAVLKSCFIAFANPVAGDGRDNTLKGTAGADRITGLGGRDTLSGGGGDDTLVGGAGRDHHDGGAGTDAVSYVGAAQGIELFLADPAANKGDAAGDTFADVERFVGTKFADVMAGGVQADRLDGGYGRDKLAGGEGIDRLLGGDGDDVLEGGLGADILDGNVGLDTASYANALRGVTANLRAPANNRGEAAGDVFLKIESLVGSAFGDSLTGDGGANRLDGGKGGDALLGGGGDDFLFGGEGDDALDAGLGNDTLHGGNGDDTFVGGPGSDHI